MFLCLKSNPNETSGKVFIKPFSELRLNKYELLLTKNSKALHTGTVKSWCEDKGMGFIVDDAGRGGGGGYTMKPGERARIAAAIKEATG